MTSESSEESAEIDPPASTKSRNGKRGAGSPPDDVAPAKK